MQAFPIAPSDARPLWLILPVVLVLIAAMWLLTVALLGSRSARFEVSGEGLRLRGDLYGRMIPLAQLRVAEARRINLDHEPELRPRWRTLGTAVPGYRGGWFRLRGGAKALLYLTDHDRAVLVPTTADYLVMLSPADPDGFLEALRRSAPPR
jgi:hypothetical protein